MTQPRTTRRALAAALSVGALLVTAACSSGAGTPASSAPADSGANWDEFGPITYAAGKDTSGVTTKAVADWNKDNPNEQITFRELPADADAQRAQMIQRQQAKSGEYTIMSIDVVWGAEFAANNWLEPLPADKFPTTGMIPAAVDAYTYFNKLYAIPESSDGAMLYYRKDLLDKANLKPPTTWAEMKAACDKVLPGESGMSCYSGQHQKYEGLTCNIAEAVNSAGGEFLTADGKPAVNTEAAIAGVQWMVDGFKSGMIPKEALTWKEPESLEAFNSSKLLFYRNWPYAYALSQKSKVKDKFGVAPLPRKHGPGVTTLGGHGFGISKFAKNKGTAMKFMLWFTSKEKQTEKLLLNTLAPVSEEIYSDPAVQAKVPWLPFLKASIDNAKARPKAVKYGDVTLAIQDATYAALQGQQDPKTAFDNLQTKLEALTK